MSDSAVADHPVNGVANHRPPQSDPGETSRSEPAAGVEPGGKRTDRPPRSSVLVREDLVAEAINFVQERYGRFFLDNVVALTLMFDWALKVRADSGQKVHELVPGWTSTEDAKFDTVSMSIDARTKALIDKATADDFFGGKGFRSATANLLLRIGLEKARGLDQVDDPFGRPLFVQEDVRSARERKEHPVKMPALRPSKQD